MTNQLHGSIPYQELKNLGINTLDVLDFSANINPFPLPFEFNYNSFIPKLKHYPDAEYTEIKSILAHKYQVSEKSILLCGGTTELIYALPHLYHKVGILVPSYGDYQKALFLQHRKAFEIPWHQSLEQISHEIRINHLDAIWICQPNNPNGEYLCDDELQFLLKSHPNCTILLDEAYQELSEEIPSCYHLIQEYTNLLVIKSWTKPYGLAGLRCGYALAHPNITPRIQDFLLPWSISTLAMDLIPLLHQHDIQFRQQWLNLIHIKKQFISKLRQLNLQVHSSQAPFFLISNVDAMLLRESALKKGILLRDCTSFGLTNTLRIMPLLPEQNQKLIDFLQNHKVNSI